jgi:hypothetical protein
VLFICNEAQDKSLTASIADCAQRFHNWATREALTIQSCIRGYNYDRHNKIKCVLKLKI